MGINKRPMARVSLYAPGQRFQQASDGFGHYMKLADGWQNGQVSCNQLLPADVGVWSGSIAGATIPAAMVIQRPGIDVATCRPFADDSQSIGLEHFDVLSGTWIELAGMGLGQEKKLYQYDGRAGMVSGLISRFILPRNPVVCLRLQRTDPPKKSETMLTETPCTQIYLGVGSNAEWGIGIPYSGPVFVMQRKNGLWERAAQAGRGLISASTAGMGADHQMQLWVAVINGKLVLSTDGFGEDVWVPDLPETVEIGQGKLELLHNAGQWAVTALPVRMYEAEILSHPIAAGYDSRTSSGELFLQTWANPVTAEDGTELTAAIVQDVSSPELNQVTQRRWAATLSPYEWVCPVTGIANYVSPELQAVQIGQYAEIVDTGASSWQNIAADVSELEIDLASGKVAALGELKIDSTELLQTQIKGYQRCKVAVGWLNEAGEEDCSQALDGVIVEPAFEAPTGQAGYISAVIADRQLRLRDERNDGRAPIFDGWLVRDVFTWVLERCGIPAEQYELEDTGKRLSAGSYAATLWQVEHGRGWGDFLRQVAEFDRSASFFVSPDGIFKKVCPHCLRLRTSADVHLHDGTVTGACGANTTWNLYTRAQEKPAAEHTAMLLSGLHPQKTLGAARYANHVTVNGVGSNGELIRVVAEDTEALRNPASERYVGWRRMAVLDRSTCSSVAEANRIALQTLALRSEEPETLEATLELTAQLRPGDTVTVHGGETLETAEQMFRVIRVTHHLQRNNDTGTWTKIVAQRLR